MPGSKNPGIFNVSANNGFFIAAALFLIAEPGDSDFRPDDFDGEYFPSPIKVPNLTYML